MLVSYLLFGSRVARTVCPTRVGAIQRIVEDLGATDFAAVPAYSATSIRMGF